MMLKPFFLVVIFFNSICYSQDTNKKITCSSIITELSFFWKTDSLGTNGFRLYTYKKIINAKLDSLDYDFLINKLGKPNAISKSNKDVTYIYFYLNPVDMPKNVELPPFLYYIGFIQKKEESLISEISEWHYDL